MKQYIKFTIKDSDNNKTTEFSYAPNSYGAIELRKLTDKINILIIHFENLDLSAESSDDEADEFLDDPISIMLANYPIKINELSDLEVDLKDGWTDDMLFTMVTFRDGESINNNKISIKKDGNGAFDVIWTGSYSTWNTDRSDRFLELNLKAKPKTEVVTPLCENEEVILETFDKKR